MKQSFWIIILVLTVAFCFTACRSPNASPDGETAEEKSPDPETSASENGQPSTQEANGADIQDAAGGALSPYSEKFSISFSIESRFYNLVDSEKMDAWMAQFEHVGQGGTRPQTELNFYNFIRECNIPKEEWIKASNLSLSFSDETFYTDEEIDLLYSDDVNAVYAYFANPWGICIEKEVYTPEWLYEQNAEQYREVGITAQMLAEKLPLIQNEFTVMTGEGEIHRAIPDRIEQQYAALQIMEGVPEHEVRVPPNEKAAQL